MASIKLALGGHVIQRCFQLSTLVGLSLFQYLDAPAVHAQASVHELAVLEGASRHRIDAVGDFSLDGRWVAAHHGSNVLVWRVSDRELVAEFEFDETVAGVQFSPDGRWLAGWSSPQGTLQCWRVQAFEEPKSDLPPVVFRTDDFLARIPRDLIKKDNGNQHTHFLRAPVWHTDSGRLFVSALIGAKRTLVFDVRLEAIEQIRLTPLRLSSAIEKIGVAQGKLWALTEVESRTRQGFRRKIRRFKQTTRPDKLAPVGRQITTSLNKYYPDVTWQYIAGVGSNGLEVLDASTGETTSCVVSLASGSHVVWAHDCHVVAAAEYESDDDAWKRRNSKVVVRDAASGEALDELPIHDDLAQKFPTGRAEYNVGSFSPDNQLLLVRLDLSYDTQHKEGITKQHRVRFYLWELESIRPKK